MEINELTQKIIGCSIEVHKSLGPGLLETAYEQCLAYELSHAGLEFKLQVPMPVIYKGVRIECGYRIDVVVEDKVIIEIKAVDKVLNIHNAQLLTYLKLSKIKLGLLINFNEKLLHKGIKRLVL